MEGQTAENKIKKALALVLLFFCLSGCATTSTTEFKQQSDVVVKTASSDKNYQIVFEAMYTHMRECWQSGVLGFLSAHGVVTGTIYSELRKAEIVITSSDATGPNVGAGSILDIFEIQAVPEGSAIRAYMSTLVWWYGTRDERWEKVNLWINGYDSCDLPAPKESDWNPSTY